MFCTYCKECIEEEDNYVYRNGKLYHLMCYHLIIEAPIDESEENFS